MSHVLISGATGFVGSELVKRMGTRARAISTREVPERWTAALLDVECVVHLAARVHQMGDVVPNPLAEFRRVNVDGTLELARRARLAGVKRFVYISSVKVNGEESVAGRPFTAADAPRPLDPYGVSKMEAEEALRALAVQTGMEVVVIRPPLVYGPGVRANFEALMRTIARGIPLPLGAIHNRRSLVALDNLVDLIVTCVDHPKAAGQVFMVSDGDDVSTADLIQRMAKAMNRKARLVAVPVFILQFIGKLTGKSNEVQRLCGSLQVDISKTQNLLGWKPPITLDEGLRRAALPWRKQ